MSMEHTKSIMLTFLILLSLGLTWNLLNFQPNYDKTGTNDILQGVSSAPEKSISSVIMPNRVFIQENSRYYLNFDSSIRENPFTFLQDAEITKLKNISNEIDRENLVDFIYKDDQVVWEYSNEVPFSIYNNIVSFDKKYADILFFDRVIIPVKNDTKVETIYFVSTVNETVYRGRIIDGDSSKFKEYIKKVKNDVPELFKFKLNNKHTVFLPTKSSTAYAVTHLTKTIEADIFKKHLFPRPDSVKHDVKDNEVIFTDGTRVLKANYTYQSLDLRKPNISNESFLEGGQLIIDAINFVNSHKGFTDQYLFEDSDNSTGQVKFRMHLNDLPIYSVYDNVTIEVQKSNEGIESYKRPLYDLQQYRLEKEEVTLPSGYDVIDKIASANHINISEIDDIFIGYNLGSSVTNNLTRVVELEPVWFVSYKNKTYTLEELTTKEKEGIRVGLE